MIRLLRWTFLLGGVLMLTLSVVLASAAHEKPMAVGVVSHESIDLGVVLYTVIPEYSFFRPITSGLGFYPEIFGLAPDGLWVYVYNPGGYYPDQPMSKAGVYRVRLDGRVVQLITPEQVRSDVWWVNQHWIIYMAYDVELQRQVLIKQSLTGGQRQVVMDWVSPHMPTSVLLSPDGTQIAYTLSLKDGAEADVLIVPITGGAPLNITANVDGEMRLSSWTTGDEWLLAHRGYQYLAIRPDGTDLQPIVDTDDQGNVLVMVEWVEAARLVIVGDSADEIFGLAIGQPTPYWTQTGYPIITPDQRFVIIQELHSGDVGDTIWKMPIEGGAPEVVATVPSMNWFARLSPDGKWLLVPNFSDDFSHQQFTLVNLRDGTTKTLHTQQAGVNANWSVDATWISMIEETATPIGYISCGAMAATVKCSNSQMALCLSSGFRRAPPIGPAALSF